MFTVFYTSDASRICQTLSFRDRDSARRFADACRVAGYFRVKIYRAVGHH